MCVGFCVCGANSEKGSTSKLEPFLYDKFFEVEEKHWWFKARTEIIFDLLSNRIGLPEGSKILDIGCGTGGPLLRFNSKFDAWGIDISDQAIDYCRKRGLRNVSSCDIQEFVQDHKDFKLVTLLDVIEHVDDDVSFLKHASDALAEDGLVLVTVPAYPFLWSQHDVVNHHKRRYTKRTLTSSMSKAGLDLRYLSHYNTILFPLAVLQRYLEKLSRTNSDSELNIPDGTVNSLFYRIFSSEKSLLKHTVLPFGVSLIAIAGKCAQTNP